MIQLEDLLASYPDINSNNMPENIQNQVTSKYEFKELASSPTEPRPGIGEFFKHQEFIGRYMIWADRLLMIHQTGTGKSCAVVRCAEYYKRMSNKGGHITQAIILVKGPSLRREFQRQIVCACTAGDYITALVQRSGEEETRRRNITREINKWYTISTYVTFVMDLSEEIDDPVQRDAKGKPKKIYRTKVSDDEIIRRFSNSFIYVDEVHNLALDDENISKTKKTFVYEQLWRIFHLIQRSKVILGSATPMINQANEIGSVMNLILPGKLTLPPDFDYRTAQKADYLEYFDGLQFPPEFQYTTATLDTYEPYFRGRVSYVRALDTGAVVTYPPGSRPVSGTTTMVDENGQTREVEFQTIVYPTEMIFEDLPDGRQVGQAIGYLDAYMRRLALDERSSFNHPLRQASVFVFPDNSYGTVGFDAYTRPLDFKVVEGKQVPKENENYQARPELQEYLLASDDPADPSANLRILSSVFAAIIDHCEKPNSGNCFVYSDYVEFGAILLGLAFQARGYEKFDEATSIFSVDKKLGPVCPSKGEGVIRTLKEQFSKPKKRYTLLTAKMVESHFDPIMEAFNSYENRHGDIIKVLIGSPKARDGINLANVLQIHISTAGWTPSATYQAMSRAIRATSHFDLITEKREEQASKLVEAMPGEEYDEKIREIELEGFSGDTHAELVRRVGVPLDIRINIDVFKHTPYITLNVDGQNTVHSISMDLYRRSEEKEIEIQRVMRIAKQCSVDCQVHYARNVRPGDVDESPICDYNKCDYGCVDNILGRAVPPEDRSTYDVLYSGPVINRVTKEIMDIFTYAFSYDISELHDIFRNDEQLQPGGVRAKFVDAALEKIISEKMRIIDRYGFPSYLRVDDSVVYLVKDYPIADEGRYPLNKYVSHLIAIRNNELSGLTQELRRDAQEDIIKQIKRTNKDDAHFDRLLNSLDDDTRTAFIEETLLNAYLHDLHPNYATGIEEKYLNFIYAINEPVQRLAAAKEVMKKIPQKQGKKPVNELKSRMQQADLETAAIPLDTDTDIVYVHIIATSKGGTVAYNDMSRYKKAEGRS